MPEGNFDGIFVVPRNGEAREGIIIVDAMGNGGRYRLPYDVCDILTDRKFSSGDEIEIAPYDVLVLEKI